MEDKLTAIISLLRHGEKDDSGNLTSTGFSQGKGQGINEQHLQGDVIIFHSGVGRVKDTVREFGKHLHIDSLELANSETVQVQDYEVPQLHYLFDGKNKGEYFANWDVTPWDDMDEAKGMSTKRIVEFLSLGEKSLESDVFPSPYEMFQRMLEIVITQIRFAGLTIAESTINFINGSHEPVIMAFVYYLFTDGGKISPQEFLAQIGESIAYAEVVDIHVWQQGDKICSLKLRFRDHEKVFSLAELESYWVHKD